MPNYYVNKLDRGDGKHEVHASRCIFLPIAKTLSVELGSFNCGADAIEAAKEHYKYVIGCGICIQDNLLKKLVSESELHSSKK